MGIRNLLASLFLLPTLTCSPMALGPPCPPSTPAEEECREGDYNNLCREVIVGHNDPNSTRINIVFAGVNRTPDEHYFNTRKELETLLTDDFFQGNMDLMNYWYVPTTAFVPTFLEGKEYRGHEGKEVGRDLAALCDLPNTFPAIFMNWHFRSNANAGRLRFYPLTEEHIEGIAISRSFIDLYEGETCQEKVTECHTSQPCEISEYLPRSVNTNDLLCRNDFSNRAVYIDAKHRTHTFAHELGHSIFGLHDEYIEESPSDLETNPANCFIGTKAECEEDSPWSHLIGESYRGQEIGCFQGCNDPMYYRSVDEGVMRSSSKTHGYGLFNEIRACRGLAVHTDRVTDYCLDLDPILRNFTKVE